jgi:hypothetical protein
MSKDEKRLVHFMNGFAAASQLARRAAENGYMVEFIILAASVIDGCLRIGLVLQHQIDTQSLEIPEELVYQGDNDRAVSERQIYRYSLDRRVIDQALFDKLQELYTARNRVVHRYIVSEITTAKIFQIARRFEKAIELVNNSVWVLEDRQAQLKVGMTRKSKHTDDNSTADRMARAKHGAEWLARALRRPATR